MKLLLIWVVAVVAVIDIDFVIIVVSFVVVVVVLFWGMTQNYPGTEFLRVFM